MPSPPLYGFALSDRASAYLDTVPKPFRSQIVRRIKALAENPHPSGAKQLRTISDGENPVYRIRSGDYRILYSVRNGSLITVLDIGHRKDVYRRKG